MAIRRSRCEGEARGNLKSSLASLGTRLRRYAPRNDTPISPFRQVEIRDPKAIENPFHMVSGDRAIGNLFENFFCIESNSKPCIGHHDSVIRAITHRDSLIPGNPFFEANLIMIWAFRWASIILP